MQDRSSLHPGRVKLIPVSGQEHVYDMVRADEPEQEGTPLSKATFLTDETAALFGLGSDAVPNEVFQLLAGGAKIATGSYTGTGTYGSSNPCKLTFDFVPQFLIFQFLNAASTVTPYVMMLRFTTSYQKDLPFTVRAVDDYYNSHYMYGKVSPDGKTVTWYHEWGASEQQNVNGTVYHYCAIG